MIFTIFLFRHCISRHLAELDAAAIVLMLDLVAETPSVLDNTALFDRRLAFHPASGDISCNCLYWQVAYSFLIPASRDAAGKVYPGSCEGNIGRQGGNAGDRSEETPAAVMNMKYYIKNKNISYVIISFHVTLYRFIS